MPLNTTQKDSRARVLCRLGLGLWVVLLFLVSSLGQAQTTIILQPDSACGKDALVRDLSPYTNYANYLQFRAHKWTNGGTPVTHRSFIEFNLSTIPQASTIVNAELSLYANPTSPGLHSTTSGSNTCYLRRVTSTWDENTLTWANQPTTTTVNEVILPASTSSLQDYLNINVTAMVQDMVNDPANSFGFMMRLITEQHYRRMNFASSDAANPLLHPKLVITFNASAIVPVLEIGPDTTICSGDSVTLDATMSTGNYNWSTGSNNNTITVDSAGTYWVEVTSCSGTFTDTIVVSVDSLPNIDLGPDSSLCMGGSLVLDPGIWSDSLLWSDNSVDTSLTITQGGTYWVQASNYCGTSTDTIIIDSDSMPSIDLGVDTLLCSGNSLQLDASWPNSAYLWQNNSSDSTFTVTQAGLYWVAVTNNCGIVSDSITVTYDSIPNIDLGPDTTLCLGDSLILDPGNWGSSLLWSDNSMDTALTVNQGGLYWVVASNSCGTVIDSVVVTNDSTPSIDLGADTMLCVGNSITLDAFWFGASYLWQDNSTDSAFSVSQAGLYSVVVSNGCGQDSDSILVTYDSIPPVDLGPDTAICQGNSFVLDVTNSASSYLWQDNSTNASINVSTTGTYAVSVTNSCGTGTDAILVSVETFPVVDLGNDTSICQGQSVQLDAFFAGAAYQWQNNAVASQLTAFTAGVYWVDVTNSCGTVRDSLVLDVNLAPAVNLGNDTSFCTGNSLTLDVAEAGAQYLWQDGSTSSMFIISQSGLYWAELTNLCGTTRDSIDVQVDEPIQLNLSADTVMCPDDAWTVDVSTPNSTYLWSNQSTRPQFTITQAGDFSVTVTNGCGSEVHSISADYLVLNIPDLGPDTVICEIDPFELDATMQDATYLWQNGSKNPRIPASTPGQYSVEISHRCGTWRDSVNISATPLPFADLGPDTLLCPNDVIDLDVDQQGGSYVWQDQSTGPVFSISSPGTYWVEVTTCQSVIDSLVVAEKDCNCYVYFPNAFTPNSNFRNDWFGPVYTCEFSDFELQIFNRWGQQIFKSTDPSLQWNGEVDGRPAPEGIYTYRFYYEDRTQVQLVRHGHVTLVR